MPAEAASVKQVLAELATKESTPILRIHYPDVTVTEPAVKLTKTATKPTPTYSIAASALTPALRNAKFIIVCLDLDAPFPSFPVLGPVLHAIKADLTPNLAAENEGWIPLAIPEGTKHVCNYAGPGPPPPSGPHRYLFMVWEQPAGLTAVKMKEMMKFADEVGIPPRMRWDQGAFERKMGLGKVLGANYYVV